MHDITMSEYTFQFIFGVCLGGAEFTYLQMRLKKSQKMDRACHFFQKCLLESLNVKPHFLRELKNDTHLLSASHRKQ